MAFELSDLDEVDVALEFLKPDGSPGTVDGVPTITTSDTAAATITNPSASGFTLRSGDNLPADAPVVITVTADVDMGSGVEERTFTSEGVVKSHTAGEVSTTNFNFSSPRRKS